MVDFIVLFQFVQAKRALQGSILEDKDVFEEGRDDADPLNTHVITDRPIIAERPGLHMCTRGGAD